MLLLVINTHTRCVFVVALPRALPPPPPPVFPLKIVAPPIFSAPAEAFPENPEEALALDPLPRSVAGRKVVIAQKSRPATTFSNRGLFAWHLTFKRQVWLNI